MESRTVTRKEFLVLTFTLVGSAVAGNACDDSDDGGTGSGGTTGGGGGTTGTAGTGGTTGTGGTSGGGGVGGSGVDGGTGALCSDPLPERQLPDNTGHVHAVIVAASALNATSPQTFDTSVVGNHQHSVTLSPAELGTLKGGGMVTSVSTVNLGHMHSYEVRCGT